MAQPVKPPLLNPRPLHAISLNAISLNAPFMRAPTPGLLAAALLAAWLPALALAEEPVRDPTLVPAAPGATAGAGTGAAAHAPAEAPVLQMIVREGERRWALVGGRTVRVGDTLEVEGGSARVERIDAAQVVLRRGSETIVLPLSQDEAGVRRHLPCNPTAPAGNRANPSCDKS
jgi:hypothetical protein